VTGVHRFCGEIPFDTCGRELVQPIHVLGEAVGIDDTATNAGREVFFRLLEKRRWLGSGTTGRTRQKK
jgi:hypothetical protein